MAKAKNRTASRASSSNGVSTTVVIILIIGVVAGFAAGFLIAKNRYTEKITEISRMNMDKAVTIDNLEQEIQVLGASTKAEE